MRAEVIAIGDELITGQRLDTNTQWLSERLLECGATVAFHTTVGDVLADNAAVFRTAIERADLVVCTGGLGPTADDLTREAIAEATGLELVRDAASLAFIRNLFTSRGREMPERNAVQADLPAGAKPIPNEYGTAPGIAMKIPRESQTDCLLFALPGVPAELKPMWHDSVAPAILAALPEPRMTCHRRVKCFGVGESQLEAMLPDMIARLREPLVGITVSDATITLRVTASGRDKAACLAKMEPTLETIHETLGSLVFGVEEEELEDAVLFQLANSDETVAVAEWGTAGLVSERLAIADDEGLFLAGSIVRSLEQADWLLGTNFAGAGDPNSREASMLLAKAARERSGADYGLGISAFPKNYQDPKQKLFVSVAMDDGTKSFRCSCASHPEIVRSRAAKQALNFLRLILIGDE